MQTRDAAEERLIELMRGLDQPMRDQVTRFVELLVQDLKDGEDRLGWTVLGMKVMAKVWDNEEDAAYDRL
jgi:hypothetical protein